MIKNYLKITWRNFRNNKFFSFVNIFGLAVGLTCCMLIALYLQHEFTYDQHYKFSNRIYKVGTVFLQTEGENKSLNTPAPIAPALQREYPEIEIATRSLELFTDDKTLLQYTDENNTIKSFYETDGYTADSTFFHVFDYTFTEGNSGIALDAPNTIVLSEEVAQKIFGRQKAVGKMIHVNSSFNGPGDYKVTGVFKPGDHPTHIAARFFLSMSSGNMGNFVKQVTDFATNNMFNTYVLLKPGTDPVKLEAKFPAFIEKYMKKDLRAAGFNKKQFLVPVSGLHLYSGLKFGTSIGSTNNKSYLYILGSVAIFILIIASINFMNLATARSAKRAAEVGIRKVLGAEKRALVQQFLGESLLLAFVSFIFALGLVQLLLPLFSSISGVQLSFNIANQSLMFAGFILLTIITGLVAGSYPAFYLSAFRPIKVLKGKFTNSLSAITLRKALVVFQFTISAALIIAAFAIGKQMNFMRTTDLGFAKDQQLIIPLRSDNAKRIHAALKNEITANRQVISAGASMYYPGILNPSDFKLYTTGKTVNDGILVKSNWTDKSFLQTLEIKPVAGRLFSEQFPADTNRRMIMNEVATKKLGFKTAENAIGKEVIFDWQGQSIRFQIVGVVKDFNYEGLKRPVEPYCFQTINSSNFNYIVAHVRPGDLQSVLQSIEKTWHALNPNEPFEYSFLDQDFQKNYEAENRLASLIQYFMVIAITICCLGLFGLAAFSAEQRTKEIGIRKVLGSSITGIVGLLSKDFMKLVIIGNLLALPVAWYMMHKWLQEFAFRTPLSWWVFAAAIVLSAIIALVTVSYQAIKSALANPVKSLRTE